MLDVAIYRSECATSNYEGQKRHHENVLGQLPAVQVVQGALIPRHLWHKYEENVDVNIFVSCIHTMHMTRYLYIERNP